MEKKEEKKTMTKEEAAVAFRQLVAQYGIHWNNQVPREAYERVQEINKVLTTVAERRAALGLPT
jgi:hypothetical protein